MRSYFSPLFQKIPSSDAVPAGGGDSPQAPPSVADPDPDPTPAAESDEPAPVSLIDRAKAAMKSKPTLQAENTQLKSENSDFRSQLSEAQSEVQRLTEENADQKSQLDELEAIIAKAESDTKTVSQKATELVTNTGIPVEELPSQDDEPADFEAAYNAAKAKGGKSLALFMKENAAEVNKRLS